MVSSPRRHDALIDGRQTCVEWLAQCRRCHSGIAVDSMKLLMKRFNVGEFVAPAKITKVASKTRAYVSLGKVLA
jgi:hypothetical protein